MTYDLAISVAKVPLNRIAIWRVRICHILFPINKFRKRQKPSGEPTDQISFTVVHMLPVVLHVVLQLYML